jgi:(p)ppGpp synthase/HD superfamily hydrolase
LKLSERFLGAIDFALNLHNDQLRKGTEIPYMSHLLAVTAIVLENGGDEDQAIAALLHDAVEDRGGLETLQVIERRFGIKVATIVKACSDATSEPKPPWKERKDDYLQSIAGKPEAALLVSLADKIHNARSILRDYRDVEEALWGRFKGDRDGTLWYYRALVEAFKKAVPGTGNLNAMAKELEGIVVNLEALCKTKGVKP